MRNLDVSTSPYFLSGIPEILPRMTEDPNLIRSYFSTDVERLSKTNGDTPWMHLAISEESNDNAIYSQDTIDYARWKSPCDSDKVPSRWCVNTPTMKLNKRATRISNPDEALIFTRNNFPNLSTMDITPFKHKDTSCVKFIERKGIVLTLLAELETRGNSIVAHSLGRCRDDRRVYESVFTDGLDRIPITTFPSSSPSSSSPTIFITESPNAPPPTPEPTFSPTDPKPEVFYKFCCLRPIKDSTSTSYLASFKNVCNENEIRCGKRFTGTIMDCNFRTAGSDYQNAVDSFKIDNTNNSNMLIIYIVVSILILTILRLGFLIHKSRLKIKQVKLKQICIRNNTILSLNDMKSNEQITVLTSIRCRLIKKLIGESNLLVKMDFLENKNPKQSMTISAFEVDPHEYYNSGSQ